MISWDRIRDRYKENFGLLQDVTESGAEEAPFFVLHFGWPREVLHVYATFGASAGPLRHEIVLAGVEPLAAYGAAVEAVARRAPVIAPGAVVPQAIPGTPFTALLFLSLDRGSFSVGRLGGPPYALRAVPITAAEQALAERDPARVTDLLVAAHARVADPFRACLVDVPPPSLASRTEIAMERRQARAAVLELQANLLRAHGPKEDAFPPPSPSAARGDDERLREGWHSELAGAVERAIQAALGPFAARHPAPVAALFGELVYVTLATHPDAVRMLDRALRPRNVPAPRGVAPDREAADASRRVVEGLALAVARFHPRESEAALLAAVQPALHAALSTFDPGDEIPVENHLWAATLPAMYEAVEDLRAPPVRGMPRVFRTVAAQEALLEYEPDPRPPLVRMREIAVRLVTEQVTAYAAGLRRREPA